MSWRNLDCSVLVTGLLLAWAMTGSAAVIQAKVGSLQETLDRANPGDIVELGPGRYPSPIRIERTVSLRGRGGVIDGGGVGTPLVVAAPGVVIEELEVVNSGEDIGAPDACIYLEPNATGAVLRNNTLRDCGFGIWVHETEGAEILDNRIWGRRGVRVADRGNGIHLFNASHLVIRGNEVRDVRDGIYVSATENSLIEANLAEHVRFGVHYMYAYDNVLRDNVMNDNVLGIALMESHHLVVEGNQMSGNQRQGLLFRDIEFSQIRRNRLEHNGIGMFFFSSTENVIEDNVLLNNEVGMKIWAGTRKNRIEGNVFRGNREQVFYVGVEDQTWGKTGRGNYWGDYLGWDQNGDGIGDRPYRVDSFMVGLLYRYPSASLLLRSPALEMLAHMADRLPMLRTPTIVDRAPLLGEPAS